MNVNLKSAQDAIKALETKHATTLKGKSGKGPDFEAGFIKGLQYIREFVLPAFETQELTEAEAIDESLTNEIEDLKAAHRFGLTKD